MVILLVEGLEDVDIINGIFTLGMVIINTMVGLILIIKSRKLKNRAIFSMGISLALLTSPWVANSVNFLLILFSYKALTPEIHLAIALIPLPIANFAWMVVITELLFKKKQKIILSAYLAFSLFFDIIVIYLLSINYQLVGTFDSPLDTVYSSLISGLILILLLTVQITSIWFFIVSRRAENPEAKLKASFFLLSSTTFVIASIIDARIETGILLIIIVRFLLLLGAIEIYWAFLLPDYIKKIFLKSPS